MVELPGRVCVTVCGTWIFYTCSEKKEVTCFSVFQFFSFTKPKKKTQKMSEEESPYMRRVRRHRAYLNTVANKIGKFNIKEQKCVLLVCDIQDGKLLTKILNEKKVRYVFSSSSTFREDTNFKTDPQLLSW